MVSSGRFGAGLVEVETRWSLDDLQSAHLVLDALELADHNAATRTK